MRAILVKEPGGPEQLVMGEYPTPQAGEGELLVRVKATALNRADVMQRRGHYPPPPGASPLLGLEMAGVVEEAGPGCSRFQPGDRVFGLLPGGGYAEFAVIPESVALPVPERFSFEEAAAVAEVFLTAYQCLFWLGDLQQGQRVLIHAGASGVGTAAIQLAKKHGTHVIVTAGSEEKLRFCKELGADAAINYKEGPFVESVMKATSEQGVHLILDFVGAPYWQQNIETLTVDGKLIIISTLGGPKVDGVNLLQLLMKRIHVMGTTLRSRDLDYKAQLTQEFAEQVLPLFETGKCKPVIDSVYDWHHVQEAHRYIESNRNIGKIVLRVGE
ncbi:NAD(P)H quinone oxidoreductase [Marinithermofilum abyssi]|uniref:NAD(P)H quinone oxidoreductase n=1 Tax=Marinithermofilum abyssi TaxID=1571185 RepID=A0A8J2VEH8_9BACL|nr:NAD(P)H-quinone oxidoreductase [Marinithermofilum abyssi]GGE08035.1 NAD(P)H quinone oxidoreductase [Marinithermofilum abyssi]